VSTPPKSPRIEILEMTEERRMRMHLAASAVNQILESQTPDMVGGAA
jgi:hypothetical protein